jgi:hypothetical protein
MIEPNQAIGEVASAAAAYLNIYFSTYTEDQKVALVDELRALVFDDLQLHKAIPLVVSGANAPPSLSMSKAFLIVLQKQSTKELIRQALNQGTQLDSIPALSLEILKMRLEI